MAKKEKELYKLLKLNPWQLYLYEIYFEKGMSCRKIADELTKMEYPTNRQAVYKLVKELKTKLN